MTTPPKPSAAAVSAAYRINHTGGNLTDEQTAKIIDGEFKELLESIKEFCGVIHSPGPDCSDELKMKFVKANNRLSTALSRTEGGE